jgi:hypothetical protein
VELHECSAVEADVRIAEAILDGLNHPADVLLQALTLALVSHAAGAVL